MASLLEKEDKETQFYLKTIKRSKSTSHLDMARKDLFSHKPIDLSTDAMIEKVHLSANARFLLLLRILLILLIFIYIPIETIFSSELEEIETQKFYESITVLIPVSIRITKWYSFITRLVIEIISGKEAIMVYISMIYMLFPFIALKLVLVINFIFYAMVLFQCMYRARRPFWRETSSDQIVNPFCLTNYSNPSLHFFFMSFVYLYSIVSIRLVLRKNALNLFLKILIFLSYFILVGGTGLILILNKINFIYQLSFAWSISLMLICALTDLDNAIHNFIYKSLKNIIKTRKYKMRILFYVFGLMLFSIIIYFFVPNDNLNDIANRLRSNPYCSKNDIKELGIQKTFLNIPYLFGLIGAFWGTSFSIEYDCGKWWNGNYTNMTIKLVMIILFSFFYNYIVSFADLLRYEIRFFLLCFTYFLQYYIVMGYFPVIFDFFKMNPLKKGNRKRDLKKSLFNKTIFNKSKRKGINENGLLDDSGNINTTKSNDASIDLTLNSQNNTPDVSRDDQGRKGEHKYKPECIIEEHEELEDDNENENNKIYEPTSLIKGFEQYSNTERFDFTIKEESPKNHNDIEQLYFHFKENKEDENDEEKSPKSAHSN